LLDGWKPAGGFQIRTAVSGFLLSYSHEANQIFGSDPKTGIPDQSLFHMEASELANEAPFGLSLFLKKAY